MKHSFLALLGIALAVALFVFMLASVVLPAFQTASAAMGGT